MKKQLTLKDIQEGKCYRIICNSKNIHRDALVYVLSRNDEPLRVGIDYSQRVWCKNIPHCHNTQKHCYLISNDLILQELNNEETILFKLENGL